MLDQLWEHLASIERQLDALAKQEERVQLLQTIPGVGRRTAEVIVSCLDEPKRFENVRQVAAYAGLIPQQHQSGQTNRLGKITKRGSRLLRTALVEAAWSGSSLGNAGLQRLGICYVCSCLWWAKDPEENSDCGSGSKVVSTLLGDAVAQSAVEFRCPANWASINQSKQVSKGKVGLESMSLKLRLVQDKTALTNKPCTLCKNS